MTADNTSSNKLKFFQVVGSALNASVTASVVIAGGLAFPIGLILPIACTLPVSGLYFYAAYRAAVKEKDWKMCLLQIGIALSYAAWGAGSILTSLGASLAQIATIASAGDLVAGAFALPAVGSKVLTGLKAVPGMIIKLNTTFDGKCKKWRVPGFKGVKPTLMAQVIKAVVTLTAVLPTIAAGGFIYHIGKGMKDSVVTIYSGIKGQTEADRRKMVLAQVKSKMESLEECLEECETKDTNKVSVNQNNIDDTTRHFNENQKAELNSFKNKISTLKNVSSTSPLPLGRKYHSKQKGKEKE